MDTDELIFKKFNIKGEGSLPLIAKGAGREELAAFLGELGCKNGAEIGVRKGEYSQRLCRNNPGLKLKSIDPWTHFRYNSTRRQESFYQYACNLLKPYGVEIIRKTSVDAAKDVSDESLDFVYIDAMHEFDFVMMDILTWVPKVKIGGIVSGHDYTPHSYFCGVKTAVEGYTSEHGIKKWYITDGDVRGEHGVPSFFWVKR